MEVYTKEKTADNIINAANQFGIEAQVIGRVEASEKQELLISANGEVLKYQ